MKIISSTPRVVRGIGRNYIDGYDIVGDGFTAHVCGIGRDGRDGSNSVVTIGSDTLRGIVRNDGVFSGLADIVSRLRAGETDAKNDASRLAAWHRANPVVPHPDAVAALVAADRPS